jgi:hypothetical protein
MQLTQIFDLHPRRTRSKRPTGFASQREPVAAAPMALPTYGPHAGDMTVGAFVECTLDVIYHDDGEELAKQARIAPAYAKVLYVCATSTT